MVDLFAMGIILFILYSGSPPFNSAHFSDAYYKLLATNRADLFWKYHSNRKSEPGFFSDSFKDLITNMLQTMANQRLGIADIVGHPWMQGPIASQEQVRAEFELRKQQINQAKAELADEKKARRQSHTNSYAQGTKRSVHTKGVLMSGQEDTEEAKEAPLDIQLAPYQHVSSNTCLFSTYDPEFIFSQLISKLTDRQCSPKVNEKKWKLTYESFKEQTQEEKDS